MSLPPLASPGALDRAMTALEAGTLCKIISGIGSRKAKRIRTLSAIYTAAGAHVLDLAPHIDVIEAGQAGVAWAERHIDGAQAPVLMVSLGTNDDPHVGTPLLDLAVCETCSHCWCEVEKWCAARPLEERHHECPSCMACMRACPFDAISIVQPGLGNPALLMELLRRGAQAVELHISGAPKKVFMQLWRDIAPLLRPETLVSFSVGSSVTDDALMAEHLDIIHTLAGDHSRILFQAEGHPMSGARRSEPLTASASAASASTSDASSEAAPDPRASASLDLIRWIQGHNGKNYVQASGGCDLTTGALAQRQDVELNGIGFGSFARHLVSDVLDLDVLDPASPTVIAAIDRARDLVGSVRPS
jgi:ferredoxin